MYVIFLPQKLIRLCGEVLAAPTENEEIQFLCIVCAKLKQDPYLVNFFLEVSCYDASEKKNGRRINIYSNIRIYDIAIYHKHIASKSTCLIGFLSTLSLICDVIGRTSQRDLRQRNLEGQRW